MLLDRVKLLLLTVVPTATEPADVMYEYAPSTSETPPPYTLAPMERRVERLDVEDEAEQPVNVLLEIEKLLLLTVVPSKTVPSDGTYEYAPTKSEMPPPYTFAPLEESASDTGEMLDVDDEAEQAVNVLLEMERLELLTVVPPETKPARGTYEYAPTKSEIPPPYTFAPFKKMLLVTEESIDVNDEAVQEVIVFFEMV
jgi:hypothetical protein